MKSRWVVFFCATLCLASLLIASSTSAAPSSLRPASESIAPTPTNNLLAHAAQVETERSHFPAKVESQVILYGRLDISQMHTLRPGSRVSRSSAIY